MSHLLYWGGRLVKPEKAKLSVLNGASLFGESLFESVPVYGGRALFLEDHLERLKKGCEFLDWQMPRPQEFKKAAALFHAVHPENFMIRFNLAQEFKMPVSPRSAGSRVPKLWAFIRPLGHDPASAFPPLGPVGVSPWTVPESGSVPNEFKWAFYMMTRRVYRQHREWKEMVRVNSKGFAVDGAGSAVLWFDGKKVLAPPKSWVGLQSVTQKKVAALCRFLKVSVVEKPWRPSQVVKRGELIFAGSGVGVMGATHLQGVKLKDPPRLVLRLWQYYRLLIQDPNFLKNRI